LSMSPGAAPPPAPVMEWLYRDPQNNIQGPFDNASMRRWLECGYFKETLPIKLTTWRQFHPLGAVFATPTVAFRTFVLNEPAPEASFEVSSLVNRLTSGLGALTSVANEPSRVPPILEDTFQFSNPATEIPQNKSSAPAVQPLPEAQPAPTAVQWEPEVRTASSQKIQGVSSATRPEGVKIDVSKISTSDNKSSILLPVTPITKPDKAEEVAPAVPSSPLERIPEIAPVAAEDTATPLPATQPKKSKKKDKPIAASHMPAESSAPVVESTPEVEKPAVPKAPAWGKTEKTQVSLKQIQEEESKRREAEPPAPTTMSSQLKSLLGVGGGKSGSVWGVKASSGPSLLEIQEQQKAQEGDVAPSGANTSSKWNTAATTVSLTDIMSEEAKKTTAAPKGPAPTSWAAKAVTGLKPEAPRTMAATPSYSAPSAAPKKQVTPPSATPAAAAAPKPVKIMSRSTDSTLEWCNQQLKKIKGDEAYDLTLIEYCMSLDSAIEIREIFAQYLGSTPQVSHFATEFIRRKEGKPVSSTVPISGPAPATETKKVSNQFVVAGKKKKKASA